jgi:hypothetical protein
MKLYEVKKANRSLRGVVRGLIGVLHGKALLIQNYIFSQQCITHYVNDQLCPPVPQKPIAVNRNTHLVPAVIMAAESALHITAMADVKND